MSVVASHIEKPKTKNRSTNSPNKESQSLIDSKPIWSENSLNLDQDSLLDDTSNSFLLQDSLFPTTESDTSSGKTNSSPTSAAASSSSENIDQPTVEIPEMEVLQGESNAEGQAVETSNKEAISYPSSPYEDPAFNALVNASEQVAAQTSQHENPEVESQRAQRAAPIAANESMGAAQTSQVEAMAAQEPNEFDAAGFKAALMAQIAQMQLPANAEEATEFDQHNNLSEIQENATSQVNQEQEQSAGPIAASSEAEPDVDAVVAREIEEIPAPNIGETPASISANRSMPSPRPESQVSTPLQDNVQEVEQQMESNNISEKQLANANEPSFSKALSSKESAKEHANSAPEQFRAGEQSTLGATAASAENISQGQLQEMHGDRQASFEGLAQTQEQTGANDSAERTRIAADINAIYEKTKTKVEGILNTLEEKVTQMFTEAATKAKQLFEQYVDRKMRAYEAERYSGLDGAARWAYDKLAGMPDEVNDFFTEGRQVYIDYIDKALDPIAEKVANELNLAKNTIQEGRNEVAKYVAELPENLQSIGTEAAETIQSQFDSLDDSVNEKQTALVDSLAAQYMESLQEVDARIEEMQAENRGLIDMAMDAIGEVIGVIIALKDMFLNLLSAIADVVNTIIEDPIGFLKNLFSGIALGLENFGKNILTHLQAGLIGWLTGALGNVGIQMPEDIFSLKGIFSLASQILGFTWDRVRAIGVKVIGEPVMKALETGFEIIMILKNEGLTGLWEYIKEQFNDLKELVIEGIKNMIRDTIIGAGIKWLLGLLSPVGAFIKAAMAIIDVVTFFVQKAAQIIELVSAFVESVRAVASGSITAVANAIEGALARAIPLVIGFLANLLGIGGLATKVVAIITKIQERVAKAITKLWMKIKELGKSFLKRLGFGDEEKDDKKGDLSSVNEPVNTKSGEHHLIYLKRDRAGKFEIIIESTPTVYKDFINKHYNKISNPTEEINKTKNDALQLAEIIDKQVAMLTGETPITSQIENDLDKKIDDLASLTKTLIDASSMSLIPDQNIIFGGKIGSFGSSMSIKYLKSKTTGQESSNLPFVENLVLMQRKNDSGNKYYRNGHLLNAHLHGPDDWKNLTPLSTKGNSNHLHGIESNLKGALPDAGQPEFKAFKYIVIPNYTRGINQSLIDEANDSDDDYIVANRVTIIEIIRAERYVPTSLSVESVELENINDAWVEKSSGPHNIKDNIPNDIGTSINDYKVTNEKVIKYPVDYKTGTRQEFLDAGLGERTVEALINVRDSRLGSSINNSDALHTEILDVWQGGGNRVTKKTINDKISF